MESYCLSSKQARFPNKQAESDGWKKTGSIKWWTAASRREIVFDLYAMLYD